MAAIFNSGETIPELLNSMRADWYKAVLNTWAGNRI